MPTHEEVVAAVESLYADELKPFGRILRKRIAELAVVAGTHGITTTWVPGSEENLPDVDIKHLKATCDESRCITVEPEEGGDWSAIINDRPQSFVNVYSPNDHYPDEMWESAAAYFEAIEEKDMYLPGGRYSCAQALQGKGLPFLVGRSLGEICHVVQLAISQRKILGYSNGAVVPYARSQSKVKEQCATYLQPCSTSNQAAAAPSGNVPAMPMATWEVARRCLRDILDSAPKAEEGGERSVPLSNVKRLFRSRYQTELSETMLGHSKLSELLQDKNFSDICMVQLQGHGYIVVEVPREENQTPTLVETLAVSGGDADSEPRRIELHGNTELRPLFCPDEPLILEADETGVLEACPSPKSQRKPRLPLSPSRLSRDGFVSGLVQRTFIHASPPPPTPPPNARLRSRSLPKDVGSGKNAWHGLEPCSFEQQHEPTESTIDSISGSALGSVAGGCGARAPSTPSSELQSCSNDQSPGQALDDPVKIQLRECHVGAATEPVKISSHGDFCAGSFSELAEDGEPRRRLLFCPDEPLTLEEHVLESAPRAQTPIGSSHIGTGVPRWPGLSPLSSPSLLVKDGCVGSMPLSKVQNTFIHSPLPPPTPLRAGASRRARSLPKNIGSDKNPWEATCQALGCLPGQIRLDSRRDGDFNPGDCGPTPSVYGGYGGREVPCSLASSPYPAYVPPSPALTASPTYSTARYTAPQRLTLAAAMPSPASHVLAPPSPSNGTNQVIRLADLL